MKEKVKSLCIHAHYKGMRVVEINGKKFPINEDLPVEYVLHILSQSFDLTRTDIKDIKFAW